MDIIPSTLINNTNIISYTKPFDAWSFTSIATNIPNHYVALSIQSLKMETETQWLKFNIPVQKVNQTCI